MLDKECQKMRDKIDVGLDLLLEKKKDEIQALRDSLSKIENTDIAETNSSILLLNMTIKIKEQVQTLVKSLEKKLIATEEAIGQE